tara:strand:- start:880 stop:1134 length:255 start_codon:yes stop_codon:yes gene_type:complete
MSLQENKKQMFEILQDNEDLLNNEENKDLKKLILWFRNTQRQNEYTIKCLRNGVEELERKNEKLKSHLRFVKENINECSYCKII